MSVWWCERGVIEIRRTTNLSLRLPIDILATSQWGFIQDFLRVWAHYKGDFGVDLSLHLRSPAIGVLCTRLYTILSAPSVKPASRTGTVEDNLLISWAEGRG